jgi:hypothetical protein
VTFSGAGFLIEERIRKQDFEIGLYTVTVNAVNNNGDSATVSGSVQIH